MKGEGGIQDREPGLDSTKLCQIKSADIQSEWLGWFCTKLLFDDEFDPTRTVMFKVTKSKDGWVIENEETGEKRVWSNDDIWKNRWEKCIIYFGHRDSLMKIVRKMALRVEYKDVYKRHLEEGGKFVVNTTQDMTIVTKKDDEYKFRQEFSKRFHKIKEDEAKTISLMMS